MTATGLGVHFGCCHSTILLALVQHDLRLLPAANYVLGDALNGDAQLNVFSNVEIRAYVKCHV